MCRLLRLRRVMANLDLLFSILQALHYNMEIFHLREKQIPVDTLELKGACFAFTDAHNMLIK